MKPSNSNNLNDPNAHPNANRQVAKPGPTGVNPWVDQQFMAANMRALPWIEPAPAEGEGIRALTNRLLEHAPLAASVFVLALVLGLAYIILATPAYRIDALLQVDERAPTQPLMVNRRGMLEPPPHPLQGEIEILRSRELLLRAIAATRYDVDIGVENRFPVVGNWFARHHAASGAPTVAEAPLGLSAFAWGGERLVLDKFEIPPIFYGQEFFIERYRADEWLLFDSDRSHVMRGPFGRDVQLDFGGQPAVIKITELVGAPGTRFRVVRNDIADVYADLAKQLQIGEPARQSGVIRLSLEAADRNHATALLNELMQAYLERAVQVHTGDAERSLAFLESQLPQSKRALEKAEEELAGYRSRTRSVNLDQESEAAFAQVVELERTRVQLELKQREMSERLRDNHPDMIMMKNQLNTVRRQLGGLNTKFTRLPRNQRDLVRLEREVTTNAAIYTSILSSIQELKVARAGMMGNARIVDAPRPSARPTRPAPAIVMSIAAGFGAMGSLGAALLFGTLRPTIRDVDEIESGVGLPSVITVPDSAKQRRATRWAFPFNSGSKSRLLTLAAPEEPAVESLRTFRMHLTHDPSAPLSKHILITSATAGVGKSFIAANLAALLGSSRRRVLLVEADMRHPHLQMYFGTPRAPGLADVLSGRERFENIVHREVLPRVDLLMSGVPRDNPADLLSSPRLRALLDELSGEYDHVVFDSVPILPAGDSLAIAQLPVSTFLVARAEHSTVREMQEATRRLTGVGATVKGVVFNGAKRLRVSNLRYYSYRTTVP
ncbi:MAG TPA: GNVR domain-containing protein [Burkholderiaceae bacterium]|nr:GNVR domain-containing protein [Burkholderiaceae bacterium]